ncbi:MAG: electron transfer flavoprotein subunit alpha/FixB family protein [Thermoproteales archaeon]|nr:electron transfer flavoprotein subunit alpha/FixB family protein [Thermoproteales archaeon]
MERRHVLVYVENINSRLNTSSFELLTKAREVADAFSGRVYSVLLSAGDDPFREAREVIARGSDVAIVYRVERELLPNYLLHAEALTSAIRRTRPALVLVSATPWGRSLAPRVAARLGVGLTADCLDVYVDESGEIVQVRPAFTGNIIAHIKTSSSPVMATIRPGVFSPPKPDYSRSGEVILADEPLTPPEGLEVVGLSRERSVRLSEASVIVAVGRGLRRREDVALFEELAKILGGEVAVSKPLVDSGWFEKERQVGFSGNIVRPRVYLAFGISGAPQHIAGMRDSEFVISVNIDPSAPMARHSDIFVVGDMYEIAQKLVNRLKAFKSYESRN